jgi:hypothetical protein
MRFVQLANRLWQDEDGFIVSLELILITILLIIGLVTGLQVLRDAILQELGDLGAAIGSINNSFAFTGSITPATTNNGVATGGPAVSVVYGSIFQDANDQNDTALQTNGGIGLGQVGVPESTALSATAGGT